jgi:hypothetical protein
MFVLEQKAVYSISYSSCFIELEHGVGDHAFFSRKQTNKEEQLGIKARAALINGNDS